MKILRIMVMGVAALVLALALLVWFMPARWAVAALGPRLHGMRLEQVDGLVWHGRAGRVLSADGMDIGQVQWTLSLSTSRTMAASADSANPVNAAAWL